MYSRASIDPRISKMLISYFSSLQSLRMISISGGLEVEVLNSVPELLARTLLQNRTRKSYSRGFVNKKEVFVDVVFHTCCVFDVV